MNKKERESILLETIKTLNEELRLLHQKYEELMNIYRVYRIGEHLNDTLARSNNAKNGKGEKR